MVTIIGLLIFNKEVFHFYLCYSIYCLCILMLQVTSNSCKYYNNSHAYRLEELLVDCATKLEGDLCVPEVQECLRKMVDNVPHPTHATNVLKLLSGDGRDALEVKHFVSSFINSGCHTSG